MKTNTNRDQAIKTLGMIQVALFSAIIIILAFTPFLGYIPLGFTRATIVHIPVIIGSLMLGPKKGAALGFVFGMTSLINNTINPTVTSFVFSPFYSLGEFHGGFGSIVISLLPRILVGVIPYFVYRAVKNSNKDSSKRFVLALGLAGLAGSLTNTLLVMNLIFLFFRDAFASVNNVASDAIYKFILSIILINGIPEALIAALLVIFIGRILMKTRFNWN